MTKKILYSLSIIAISFAIEIVGIIFRSYLGGMPADCLFGFIAYLACTNYFLKNHKGRFKPYQVICLVTTGWLFVSGPSWGSDFNSSLVSLPDLVMHLLGIFAGDIFYKRYRSVYKAGLALAVIIVVLTSTYGYTLWLFKLNYGNFTGKVHLPARPIRMLDETNQKIVLQKGKVTVLDFWFIGCSACMKGFPEFQKTYSIYKQRPDVQFCSVNIDGGRNFRTNPLSF